MFNYCVKAPHLGLKLSEALQTKEKKSSFLIYIPTHRPIGQWPPCVLSPQFSFSLVIFLAWSASSSSAKTNLSFISSLDVNLLSTTTQTLVIKIHHKECNSAWFLLRNLILVIHKTFSSREEGYGKQYVAL
jgi:hypothetical protein